MKKSENSEARQQLIYRLALIALIAAVWIQVSFQQNFREATLAALLTGLVLWLVVLRGIGLGLLGSRAVMAAAAAALAGCVFFPPATSKDYNAYALYGRMVSEYGISPYEHTPRDIAFDPYYATSSFYWADAPSVYGPAFTAVSAAVTTVAGESLTTARVLFQLIAALSLALSAWLVGRRSLPAGAFVGLNPLLLTFGVNDAHADLLVGLGIVVGSLLLFRRSLALAAVAMVLATLVKFSAAPALAGAAVWLFCNYGWRASARFSAWAAGLLAAGLLLGEGKAALAALGDASARHTRFSIWSPLHGLLSELSLNGQTLWGLDIDRFIGTLASLVVATVGLLVIWRTRHGNPFAPVAAGLVTYQVLGAYTLVWYAAWSLPVLALALRSRLTWVAVIHGAWVSIAYLNGYVSMLLLGLAVAAWLKWRRDEVIVRLCQMLKLQPK